MCKILLYEIILHRLLLLEMEIHAEQVVTNLVCCRYNVYISKHKQRTKLLAHKNIFPFHSLTEVRPVNR